MTKVINGSLPFTPSVEYSKYVEYSNIKEYETDKKMRILWQDIRAKDIYDFCCREFGEENVVLFIVHLDELNPHAHAVVVSITKDGRLSAKDLFGGNDKNQARTRMRELHSRLAEVNEKYGLERGDDITITELSISQQKLIAGSWLMNAALCQMK